METPKAEEENISDTGASVQDGVDDTMSGAGTPLAGKTKALCCKALQLCADTGNTTRATMANKPFTTLAVAAAAGLVLGAVWSRKLANPGERAD